MKSYLVFIMCLLSVVAFIYSCGSGDDEAIVPEEVKEVTFVFSGDIMTHPFLEGSLAGDDSMFMHLSNDLKADVSFANLEFTVNTNRGPLPYPKFNGTYEYLKYFSSFFNLYSVANNHVYDQGAQSQVETMGFISDFGVLAIGGSTNEEYVKPVITNINGVDIFLAAFSTIDNGLAKWNTKDKNGYTYYMNFYPNYNELIEKLKSDLENVPEETLRIVSIHYGDEYVTAVRPYDKKLLRDMVEAGVDIVVGHHPHVPRPAQWYEGINHSGVIIYSLGNLIADHKYTYDYIDTGVTVKLTVNDKKEYDFSYFSTYIHYYYTEDKIERARVIPTHDDPSLGLPYTNLYKYTDVDARRMKAGYDLVNSFYSNITGIKQGYNFTNKLAINDIATTNE